MAMGMAVVNEDQKGKGGGVKASMPLGSMASEGVYYTPLSIYIPLSPNLSPSLPMIYYHIHPTTASNTHTLSLKNVYALRSMASEGVYI